jgi:TolA-binding protein
MNAINKLVLVLILPLLFSCNGSTNSEKISEEEQLALIETEEAALFNKDAKFDFAKAAILITNYDKYATHYPDKENAAPFLFKAGDLAMGMNRAAEAIAFFDRVYTKHPTFEKAPYAFFLKGFVLENQVGDVQQAEKIYNEFLAKFPDHAMAESAQFALKNLGKSPEELIRQFEEQNASQAPQ